MAWSARLASKGNLAAAIVATLTFAAILTAPFWLIKLGQLMKSERAGQVFATASHKGQVVHDGTMSFTVEALRCGVTQIGSQHPTHGQFCVLTLTVGNEGSAPAVFASAAQRAMGSRGAFYVADAAADAAANNASDAVPGPAPYQAQSAEQSEARPPVAPPLNPGATRRLHLVYDIPADVRLTQIDLHAGEYTRGAVVAL